MCGIFGVTSSFRHVAKVIVEGLKRLEYRGYDSAGVATVFNGRLYIAKGAGKIAELEKRLCMSKLPGYTGIGHTRWATHGPPTDSNAHPHTDCNGMVAVVHNGTISNYAELRKELMSRGHKFRSETDTEVISHLIEEFLARGLDLVSAVAESLKRLEGSFALAVVSPLYPDTIVCAAYENPLVIGIGSGEMYCSSDIPALAPLTKKFVKLLDGDLAVLTPSRYEIFRFSDVSPVKRPVIEVDIDESSIERGRYRHYMLKEIFEQPYAMFSTINSVRRGLEELIKAIVSCDEVLFVASGTSYNASLYGAYLLREVGIKARAEIASEAKHFNEGTLVFAVTQSGETADVLAAVREARKQGCKVAALTNTVASSVTFLSDYVVYTAAGPEVSVAATKTYTAQLTALSILAHETARETGRELFSSAPDNEIRRIAKSLLKTLDSLSNKARKVARLLAQARSMYVLSRGVNVVTAMEGALKVKEVAYIHAEAYPAGEMKHGPLALIEEGFPTVFIVPNNETLRKKIVYNIEEALSRGATLVFVEDVPLQHNSPAARFTLSMHVDELLTPIPCIVPLQLLAYWLAVELGRDPDRPRNLAKSVTVE